MKYEMTVEETFQKRLTSRKYLNGVWSRTFRDITEINDEINGMLKSLNHRHDVLNVSSSRRGQTVEVNIEFARPGKIGRLNRLISIKKASERRINQEDLI